MQVAYLQTFLIYKSCGSWGSGALHAETTCWVLKYLQSFQVMIKRYKCHTWGINKLNHISHFLKFSHYFQLTDHWLKSLDILGIFVSLFTEFIIFKHFFALIKSCFLCFHAIFVHTVHRFKTCFLLKNRCVLSSSVSIRDFFLMGAFPGHMRNELTQSHLPTRNIGNDGSVS